MQYGLPYKGSKSKIADAIIEYLPPAKVLYDLFAGGCAITHAAVLSGKWDMVVANDIAPYPQLFKDAINGKYRNDYRWVSREDFFKSEDPFDKLVFSFGTDCRTYLYAEGDVENWKKALHYAVCFHDYGPMRELGTDLSPIESCKTMKQRRMMAYRLLGGNNEDKQVHLENLERNERLQNLERMERIHGLSRLGNKERLVVSRGTYDAVEIDSDSIIYCDIPYVGTNGYGSKKVSDFDYDAFYKWAVSQSVPVYVSEYWMPPDMFDCIFEVKTKSLMSANSPTVETERLFVPRGMSYQKTTLF